MIFINACIDMYHSLWEQWIVEIIGLYKISHSIKQPCRSVCLKKSINLRNVSKLLKQCSTLTKQSGKSNVSVYSKLLKFQAMHKFVCWTANLPAVRLSSAWYRPPDFSQVMYSRVGFTDFLVHWRFVNVPSRFLLTITGFPSSSLFC